MTVEEISVREEVFIENISYVLCVNTAFLQAIKTAEAVIGAIPTDRLADIYIPLLTRLAANEW